MNKYGFTITELLAVIVILGIVGTIATIGIIAVQDNINKELFASKKEIIIEAAKLYGQDNRLIIENGSNDLVTVGDLIADNYLDSGDYCADIKCLKNDITDKNMKDDVLRIYIENNRIYAEFSDIKSCFSNDNLNLCE